MPLAGMLRTKTLRGARSKRRSWRYFIGCQMFAMLRDAGLTAVTQRNAVLIVSE
jgi:hypothetical protein